MGSVVSISGPHTAEVVDEEDIGLAAGEVRVRTIYSGISAGTELTEYRGTNPYLDKTWDPTARLFKAGIPTNDYPLVGLGYEEVGEVVECATGVTDVRVGDRVWGIWGHRSHAVKSAEYAAARLLEPDADARIGIFSHIGSVALNVVLDADIHLGETVAVFGLGVPGQLAAQFARLNGARVIAVDAVASRREMAADMGADEVLDPTEGCVAERIRDLTGGRGADVCLEITGSYAALHEAVRSVAYNAKVCVGGFFQGGGTDLRLGEEFHLNRVQLVCSQISGVSSSLQHRWDRNRLASTVIELATRGRVQVLSLFTHTFPVSQAARAYQLLDQRPADVLQVLLDFETETA
jgi:2-desacetyl-2-hydroxyethyl bacteriochlorophyllide A dehydrogenase